LKACITVANSFDPDLRAKWIAEVFLEKNISVDVLALRSAKYADYYWEDKDEDILIHRHVYELPLLPYTPRRAKAMAKVFSWLFKSKADYYCVTDYRYLPYVYFLTFFRDFKFIFDYQTKDGNTFLEKFLIKFTSNKFDYIITSDRFGKEFLAKLGIKDAFIVSEPFITTQLSWCDTGGQALRRAKAVRENTNNTFRVFAFEQPKNFGDIPRVDLDFDLLDRSLESSKVLIFNDLIYKAQVLKNKIYISYHNGTAYRSNPDYYKEFDAKADAVFVSTLDLLKINKKSLWLPNIVDIEYIQQFKSEKESDCFVVSHSAISEKNSDVRNTKLIREAIEELQHEGHNIKLNYIHKVPFLTAIKMKAESDVFVDHMASMGYGNGSIEAMALGKPVIKGYCDEGQAKNLFGILPYVPVKTKKELKAAILKFKDDKKFYNLMVKIGLEHAEISPSN
jgi:glycosyltransferase involved in cell wall biosynthesis